MAIFVGARWSSGILTLSFNDGSRVENAVCNPTLSNMKALLKMTGSNLSAVEIMRELSE